MAQSRSEVSNWYINAPQWTWRQSKENGFVLDIHSEDFWILLKESPSSRTPNVREEEGQRVHDDVNRRQDRYGES